MDFGVIQSRPTLVEPGVKNFLDNALYHSYVYRSKWDYFAFNFVIGALFFSFITIYLLYKYKTRPPRYELERRNQERYQETLAVIKQHQMNKLRESQGLISGLPNWHNEYETILQGQQYYR